MKEQIYLNNYYELNNILKNNNSILIVCNKSLLESSFLNYLQSLNINCCFFTDFKPNPKYEDVIKGIKTFKKNKCNFIIAFGGGSAIDVAKCIKAFSSLNENENYLNQKIIKNNIKLLAIPTTAGTGSESTHFAVIYYQNIKYSIEDDNILPDYVFLEPKFIESLPLYQKKATLLDALCQGIESYWSVNSTDESKKYAKKAIKLILNNYKEYISGNNSKNKYILEAANYSGRAINISKTTAAHAMSYKITSLYGLSHGHAVAVCLPYIWEYMVNHISEVIDPRGENYLENIFCDLDEIFVTNSHKDTISKLINIYDDIEIKHTNIINSKDLKDLTKSVNLDRLKNNPVKLSSDSIKKIYSNLI